jgi:DNA-binding protein H-NS
LESEKENKGAHQELPEGIKELVEIPGEKNAADTSSSQSSAPQREKTPKEQELDALIAKRQVILDQLKAKNPIVSETRRKISIMIASMRGKGGGRTFGLIDEAERIEFAIATEADTPKKEKELIKQLKEVKAEIAKNKELDAARKGIDAERHILNTLISEIKELEHQLVETRKACDEAYAAVVSERKAAYEQRQKGRQERGERPERKFEDAPRRRARPERKSEYDADMDKYMKDYDDTVSMEEIVVFEKKEKKEQKEE